jgi:hypothetical protein
MSNTTNSNTQIYMDKIQDLFHKYESHPYMLQRLCYHITDILPTTLETELRNHEKRAERTAYLTNEQKIFIQIFLSKHPYYYLPSTNCFYEYNGKTYTSVTEDDIQYQLLSAISKDRTLMQWKHKTKINIIKQIKERHLFKSIPETETIQTIINILCPLLFSTKSQVKYFLTIIGDSILKKPNDLLFLTKPKTKKILQEIDAICYMITNQANITNNFVTKFNESYDFQNCRLIQMNDSISCDIFNKYALDFLCVAAHYSARYQSSDMYLQQSSEELTNYTLYLKYNTQQTILDSFCNYSIESTQPNDKQFVISWKNMHFIWKLFISKHSLPSVIYVNSFKKLLRERYEYNETTDSFLHVTSKYLPFVSHFNQFWEQTITYNPAIDTDLEIDELCGLLKKWSLEQGSPCHTIVEHDILKILHHYYPSIEIIDQKYIQYVHCSLWNKMEDIRNALQSYKTLYKGSQTSLLIPFSELYSFYIKHKPSKLTISKRYFEKYLYCELTEFIEFDTFISISWLDA